MNGKRSINTKFNFIETLKQLVSHYKKIIIYYYIFAFNSKKIFNHDSFETTKINNEIEKNGFTILKNFFDKNSIIKIKKKFEEQINKNKDLYISENINYKVSGIKNLSDKIQDVTLKEPLINIPELINIITDLRIKTIADNYFKSETFITGINLRKSYANKLSSSGTQMFHVDRNSYKILKFFIYLNDVTSDDGPTMIVKGTNKRKHSFWYHKHRYSDEEIYNIYGKNSVEELIANIGDIQIADTTGYHKGKKPTKNNRYMLTLSFGILKDKNQQKFKINSNLFNKLNFAQKNNISRIVNII